MTRKDYQGIAGALFRARKACETDNQVRGVERAMNCLIDVLAQDNALFNRALFEYACRSGDVMARKPKAA